MRRGYDPRIVISNSGRILGIATGSDACTEHECGSRPLQESLTGYTMHSELEIVAKLQKSQTLLGKLTGGGEVQIPGVLERKRIKQNLSNIKIDVTEGDTPEAILMYYPRAASEPKDFINELSFYRDDETAGAWDEKSFAFRVRGKKNVQRLVELHEKIMSGAVCFAGSFATDDKGKCMGGVILMIEDRLRAEYIDKMEQAQQEYESNLRLKASARVVELNTLMRKHLPGEYVGHIWAVWGDEGQEHIMYCLNPAHMVKAQYYGPYTFDEMAAWLKAKCSYPLMPKEKSEYSR